MFQNSNAKRKLGFEGEEFVANWLLDKGFKIQEKNYKRKFGEIDLIAMKQNVIAFIEVKTRASKYFHLSEIINIAKQKKIILTAKEYISKHQFNNTVYRFDVALVERKNKKLEIKYIENAFMENNNF